MSAALASSLRVTMVHSSSRATSDDSLPRCSRLWPPRCRQQWSVGRPGCQSSHSKGVSDGHFQLRTYSLVFKAVTKFLLEQVCPMADFYFGQCHRYCWRCSIALNEANWHPHFQEDWMRRVRRWLVTPVTENASMHMCGRSVTAD